MTGTPESFAAAIRTAPVAWDARKGADIVARLPEELRLGAAGDLLRGVCASAPYLARLTERHGAWLAARMEETPQAALASVLSEMGEAATHPAEDRRLGAALRQAKSRGALLIALADLGGVWDLGQITGALSDLAEAATRTATSALLAEALRRGRLPGLGPDDLATGAGYAIIAMGKLGARELNYSSDIDLICLFDQDRVAPQDYAEAKAGYIRVTRGLVKLLSDQTAEGYVFRTDLRLRPTPSTTPVCLAMEAAERYYERQGRTWERAAHIKARPVAGDIPAADAYLQRLEPFVWRRHLDFAAIEDTHEMLRKIRAKSGKFTAEGLPGHDIKLEPGGIREIEFFAQTRQLIGGGRRPALRAPATCDALAALARHGWIKAETADQLTADYTAHRTLEHRLQMVEDAQTQTIPASAEARERIAALSGWADRAAWERDIAERLARVHAATEAFFKPPEDQAAARADPEEITEERLAALGFKRPEDACRRIERWRSGALPATRTARARRLYAGLEPRIIGALSKGHSPDEAIAEFDRFLSGLPAGVQVFSLFTANPHLLDLIVEICAVAPRLSVHLGLEPKALDALLSGDFFAPLPDTAALRDDLEAWLGREADYERVLDGVRRWAREFRFRAGVQVLTATADAREAGGAFSAIAEACLGALFPRVVADFAARHGPPPGRGLSVIALGKLGSREMTASSDLDLITVYDAGGAESSDGPRPLAPSVYYPRLTQALVAALTAPTAEGRLYEVDMRLRPSGRQGPVAVSLGAFRTYHAEKAWVWEHMALTRARVVGGAPEAGRAVSETIAEIVRARSGAADIWPEAAEMRSRLMEAHQAERREPWALKHAAGGLMEIEFFAQAGALRLGLTPPVGAEVALPEMVAAGMLSAEAGERLAAAHRLQMGLQQVERVAMEKPLHEAPPGRALQATLAAALGFPAYSALEAALLAAQAEAAEIVARAFAGPVTPA